MVVPFKTPANELSFSALIDTALLATGKPQSLISAVSHANAVIRECQALGLFARDLIEDVLIVPADQAGAYTWTRPINFRSLRTVKYKNCCEWPELALPGRKQKDKKYFFYAADNYFVFSGASANENIATATYYWQTRLGYFSLLGVNTQNFPGGPYDTRPAYYDTDLGLWQYLNAAGDGYVDTTGDPDQDELRQRQATNWLVSDWYDLILSGTKSKVWTSAGDARAGAEYSNYKQLQKTLQLTAQYEGEGF